MRITKYSTLLDDNGFPGLFKEKAVNYGKHKFVNAGEIASMMNNVFQLDRKTEEFLYELCFDTKMKLLGVFEISHGTINCTVSSPREVFQKALLCGAAALVIVHNHPSGDTIPSDQDYHTKEGIDKAGELIGILAVDHIIIGKNGRYFSFNGK